MTTTVPDAAKAVRHQRHDVADKPFITIWEVTRACQLACLHCRADAITRRDPLELSLDEGKALLDQIASFPKPYPLVVLTGGDPFERPDLGELTAYGSSLGLSMALSPSATPNLTTERLGELRDAGGKAVSLSLDGAQAPTHDAFRGFEGTFDRTLDAARLATDAGFRLQINSTVTRSTVLELPRLLTTVLDLGAKLWSVFFLVPTGRGQQLQTLSPDEVEDVLHWLVDVSRFIAIKTTEAPHYRRVVLQRLDAARAGRTPEHGPLHAELTAMTRELLGDREVHERPARPPIDVNSGRGFVFIDHQGWVYPSGFLPHRAGNVRDTPLPEIYRESPIMRALRTPEQFVGKCGVCEFREVCGGSRSHAYAVTGDPLASDPTCSYVPAAALGSAAAQGGVAASAAAQMRAHAH
ncbi:TIGR04053 family radical SAM/SPASM domain-containing protein [Arsenicicoccus sp. oral taxon 190]|uniref:TIGR04053 family radical SAM/SPASM domain-containing protein n=1 Tax=Arsenicicoccus sp. oral taxon 190 TaxID=1658671 RepID=UPI000679F6B2|nr:TIGR04053 family radical SAM/SPASM domain-containing protein [Arsenicicoccus sp. oral taxon 190]AKT50138.1 pyrroloquinoline quinone biosynthesis protein PqqE [Arsenicicoccus sp. oral taxon 190]